MTSTVVGEKFFVDTDGAAGVILGCEDPNCGWEVNLGLSPSLGQLCQFAVAHHCGARHE